MAAMWIIGRGEDRIRVGGLMEVFCMTRPRRLVILLGLAAAIQGCAVKAPPAEADPNTCLVMADSRGELSGVNASIFVALLAEATRRFPRPQALFFVGDMAYSGTTRNYGLWKSFTAPYFRMDHVYPAFGNHDEPEANFNAAFPHLPSGQVPGFDRTVYTVDRGGIRFIVLNPRDNRIDLAQRKWLARMLAKPRPRHAFILVHEPFYPTGAHLGSSLDLRPGERDAAWRIIDRGGAEIVFTGAPLADILDQSEQPSVNVFRASFNYALARTVNGTVIVTVYGPGRKTLDRIVVP
jgi:hypothetical protein